MHGELDIYLFPNTDFANSGVKYDQFEVHTEWKTVRSVSSVCKNSDVYLAPGAEYAGMWMRAEEWVSFTFTLVGLSTPCPIIIFFFNLNLHCRSWIARS